MLLRDVDAGKTFTIDKYKDPTEYTIVSFDTASPIANCTREEKGKKVNVFVHATCKVTVLRRKK